MDLGEEGGMNGMGGEPEMGSEEEKDSRGSTRYNPTTRCHPNIRFQGRPKPIQRIYVLEEICLFSASLPSFFRV